MKSFFVIDENGRGFEEVHTFLRKRGYSVNECEPESHDELHLPLFVIDRACVQVFWLTRDLRIIYVNDAACKSLGYTREELTRMSVSDIDPFYDVPNGTEYSEHWQKFQKTGRNSAETYHRAKDGRVFPVEIRFNLLEFDGREYCCCFVTDISDRKSVEEKLLLQQFCIEKADTIFMQFSADEVKKILMVNEAACRSLGYTRDELLALSDVDITPNYTIEERRDLLRNLEACGSLTGETFLRRKDGSIFQVEFTANKIDFHGKSYLVGFSRDITEQKRAEKAHFAHEKQLAAMTMELSLAEQRERSRIAAELHDGIGQILTLARIRLGLLASGVNGKEVDNPLADIMELVDSANREIRSLAGQLSPPILEVAGLDAALSWLAGKMQMDYGLDVEFLSDNTPRPLSPEIRGIIYQAARELLINVVKHAQSGHARLSVEREGEMLILTVDDHGAGFCADKNQPVSKEGCFGLFNIHQRMMHLGGEMSIASTPGAGTRIQLRMPLRKTVTKENGNNDTRAFGGRSPDRTEGT